MMDLDSTTEIMQIAIICAYTKMKHKNKLCQSNMDKFMESIHKSHRKKYSDNPDNNFKDSMDNICEDLRSNDDSEFNDLADMIGKSMRSEYFYRCEYNI